MAYRAGVSGYLPGSGTTLTLTVPAGVQASDVGLIAVGTTDTSGTKTITATSSAGTVTVIQSLVRSGSQNQSYALWSITGVAAGGTVTLTFSAAIFATAGAAWWSGVNAIDLTGTVGARTSSSATVTAPTLTTTAAGDTVACVFVERTTSPGPSTSFTLSGATQELFVPGEASPACTNSVAFADFTQATAGATQNVVATYPAASGNAVGVQVALKTSSSPPSAAFTDTTSALTASVDGTSSSAVSPATVSSYDWDWGDSSTHGTGSTASHTYTAGGTYTITLTVTDSNGLTGTVSHSVTVTAPAGTVTARAVTASTGWTPSSGSALSCITDNDPTSFVTSSSGPSGLEFDLQLQPMIPPASGQPLKVFLTMDKQGATSGSLAAQLYEGATLRSSLTGVAIPDGSGSSVLGMVTLTFPASDVQNVTSGGWNAGLTVKLQVTAS